MERLLTDRDQVRLDPARVEVDLYGVRAVAREGFLEVPTDLLRAAAASFRGEFAEGLNVPTASHRFAAWLDGERASVRKLRLDLLTVLSERLRNRPEEAVVYARERVVVDPLSENAHRDLIERLAAMGRFDEALEQYERCRDMLTSAFHASPSAELERLRTSLRGGVVTRPNPVRVDQEPLPRSLPPLVGRQVERNVFQDAIRTAQARQTPDVLIISGEPGIGKTRLLDELASDVLSQGGRVLRGRCYDSERLRPYGPWLDALAAMDRASILRGRSVSPEQEPDRSVMFDEVIRLLGVLAQGARLLALILDDVHGLDEASAALLHYCARHTGDMGVLIACATRDLELDENASALRLVQSFQREGRLRRLDLGPLSFDETRELVRRMDSQVDHASLYSESGGNPLMALELARARRGVGGDGSPSLQALVEERLTRLGAAARAVLPWAAALGHRIPLDLLAQVTSIAPAELVQMLDVLERGGILAPEEGETYAFTHDLVRRILYERLTPPRRRLVHSQIAQVLEKWREIEPSLAGSIAHHAALGGNSRLAAKAYAEAARQAVCVFAFEEAAALTSRGLGHVSLQAAEDLALRLDLLEVYVHPGMAPHRPSGYEVEVRRAATLARAEGRHELVQKAFCLLANVYYQRGDFVRALEDTLQAEKAGRTCEPETVVRALADTARCLGMLDQEMERAERLAREAEALSCEAGLPGRPYEIPMAFGLVRHFAGAYDEAATLFTEAGELARRQGQHWWACYCKLRLPMIELERAAPVRALERCRAVAEMAEKMGDGSEGPFVRGLEAVALLALDEPRAEEAVDAAAERLRTVDSKWMLAYIQGLAGEIDLRARRIESARRRAVEALEAASAVKRWSEATVARAILVRTCAAARDMERAGLHLQAMRDAMRGALSARARNAVRTAVNVVPN